MVKDDRLHVLHEVEGIGVSALWSNGYERSVVRDHTYTLLLRCLWLRKSLVGAWALAKFPKERRRVLATEAEAVDEDAVDCLVGACGVRDVVQVTVGVWRL